MGFHDQLGIAPKPVANTLSASMEEQGSREFILDPNAKDMGCAGFQESNSKIWWTVIMGG